MNAMLHFAAIAEFIPPLFCLVIHFIFFNLYFLQEKTIILSQHALTTDSAIHSCVILKRNIDLVPEYKTQTVVRIDLMSSSEEQALDWYHL